MDKSTKKYWNNLNAKANSNSIKEINANDFSLENYVKLKFHQFFLKIFDKSKTPFMKIIEIGCANSEWLPYFSKEFGFKVTGMDYSNIGCLKAKDFLKKSGVIADVFCSDFRSPPSKKMMKSFDVLVSFGLVEHFEDTVATIRDLALYIKPGGIIITIIPNMTGAIGAMQKILNRSVYETHNPIDSYSLLLAHRTNNFEISQCHYFMSTSFGVCNLHGIPRYSFSWFAKKLFLFIFVRISKLIWFIESKLDFAFNASKFFSPYIVCVAYKKIPKSRG